MKSILRLAVYYIELVGGYDFRFLLSLRQGIYRIRYIESYVFQQKLLRNDLIAINLAVYIGDTIQHLSI